MTKHLVTSKAAERECGDTNASGEKQTEQTSAHCDTSVQWRSGEVVVGKRQSTATSLADQQTF